MTKEQFINHITETFSSCLEIVSRKNADYSGNAEDPFKNFRMSVQVGVTPERGLLVRISDKISRISNLLDKEAAVKDESISDSIDDAINYLAILKAKIYDNLENNLPRV
jgi:hypothetical protein